MSKILKIAAFALFMSTLVNASPSVAGDKKDRDTIRDLGYIAGREIAGNDDDNTKYYKGKDKSRVYTTKKLYENDDIIIYRGYDTKGRKYTVTKRK